MMTREDIVISNTFHNYGEVRSKNDPNAIERFYESTTVEFYLFMLLKCEATFYSKIKIEDDIKDQIIEIFKDKLPDDIESNAFELNHTIDILRSKSNYWETLYIKEKNKNMELKEQLDQVYKSAKFWENEYHKETNKPSYKLMFYTSLVLFLFVSIVLYTKL